MSKPKIKLRLPPLPKAPEAPTEPEVRALRDQVFGVPITDKGWDSVKAAWMRGDSIEWLTGKSKIPMPKL